MKVTQVTYARLYNLGNYENERFEVTLDVMDGDTAYAAWTAAIVEVLNARKNAEIVRKAEQERIEREWQEERARRLAEANRGDGEGVEAEIT